MRDWRKDVCAETSEEIGRSIGVQVLPDLPLEVLTGAIEALNLMPTKKERERLKRVLSDTRMKPVWKRVAKWNRYQHDNELILYVAIFATQDLKDTLLPTYGSGLMRSDLEELESLGKRLSARSKRIRTRYSGARPLYYLPHSLPSKTRHSKDLVFLQQTERWGRAIRKWAAEQREFYDAETRDSCPLTGKPNARNSDVAYYVRRVAATLREIFRGYPAGLDQVLSTLSEVQYGDRGLDIDGVKKRLRVLKRAYFSPSKKGNFARRAISD